MLEIYKNYSKREFTVCSTAFYFIMAYEFTSFYLQPGQTTSWTTSLSPSGVRTSLSQIPMLRWVVMGHAQ